MANDDRLYKNINSKIDNLSNTLDGIFSDEYSSNMDNEKELKRITSDIYERIDNILSKNTNIQGVPNITQLYTRLQKNNGGITGNKEIMDGLNDIVNNKNLSSLMTSNTDLNRYIKLKDMQIDMVLKYMPKLATALAIKKDNVLSADSFSKEFVFASNDSTTDPEKEAKFAQRDTELKEKYDIEDLFEKIYDETATYGESFLYIVPYKKAFERLMNGSNNTNTPVIESCDLINNGIASSDITSLAESSELTKLKSDINSNKGNLKITFNKKSVLSNVIRNYRKASKIMESTTGTSLYEAFVNESSKDKVFNSDLEYDKLYNKVNDGLTLQSSNSNTGTKINNIPGCVVKRLDRENVIPIYIENICLGYYYIEIEGSYTDDIDRNKALLTRSLDSSVENELSDGNDYIVKYIASAISKNIDKKFINANQDLKEEIYIMLKYNNRFNLSNTDGNINVTFIPPEDIYHFYFQLDEKTHRGISDLDRSLIPAMFWCLLELSTTMGYVTRAQDKRIYYVKQNVETNVARTLLNVINQLKKGNMGIRQMESMNNILGIIGKYNDHIIPMGQSGDAPIQFEVMQGQQIETPTDLMNKYEENAINTTDVPLELVNSSDQMDFAIRFTMANSKFMRKVFKRQAVIQRKYSLIYSKIYNYEFDENDSISIQLPAPAFLSMTNGVQLINNTREYVNAIADLEFPNGDEEERPEFVKLMIRHLLPTYIDVDIIDTFKSKAKINLEITKSKIKMGEDDTTDEEMM